MELWLPTTWESSNKRFVMNGNGGLNGCIQHGDYPYLTTLGFAVAGHNNGHDGSDGTYFLNAPEVIIDFAWRAMYAAADVGKVATNTFYESTIKKSYYFGCSTGGRQGMKAAQDFPEQYDGILASSAVVDFNHLGDWFEYLYLATGPPTAPSFLSTDQWALVHQEVLNQCDGIDGVIDGVLEDPQKCRFRPEALICAKGKSPSGGTCLTPAQTETIRKVFSPMYGIDGEFIFPALQPGAEILASYVSLGGAPYSLSTEWWQNVVFNNSNWDYNTWNLNDVAILDNQNPGGISTFNADLSSLKSHGTKLISTHGLEDGLITSENTYRYYNHVARNMSLTTSEIDDFYRFFPISGESHCSGGDGAWFVGSSAQLTLTDPKSGLHIDSSETLLMKLVAWVEDGVAVDKVLGTKYLNDDIGGKVLFQRYQCKYPLQNTYKGFGNPNVTSSWTCQ